MLKAKKPAHFGTVSGYPTPFRMIVLFSGAILLGHLIMNVAIFAWAASNAHVSSRELGFPLGMGILAPLLSSVFTILIGLGVPVCICCCGAGAKGAQAHWGHRLTCFLFGLFHMFIHAGYLVAPPLLIIASLLPASVADRGAPGRDSYADHGKGKVSSTEAGGLPMVDKAPETSSM